MNSPGVTPATVGLCRLTVLRYQYRRRACRPQVWADYRAMAGYYRQVLLSGAQHLPRLVSADRDYSTIVAKCSRLAQS